MSISGAQMTITTTVLSWTGTRSEPHRFGGVEYLLGRREIGHIHGDRLVDIPFPTKIRNEIVNAGRAEPHHLLADSGWVSLYIREEADVERAIALLHMSYEIAATQRSRRIHDDASPTSVTPD